MLSVTLPDVNGHCLFDGPSPRRANLSRNQNQRRDPGWTASVSNDCRGPLGFAVERQPDDNRAAAAGRGVRVDDDSEQVVVVLPHRLIDQPFAGNVEPMQPVPAAGVEDSPRPGNATGVADTEHK
jgi:hypothetical protein